MLTEAQAKKSKFFTTRADPNDFNFFLLVLIANGFVSTTLSLNRLAECQRFVKNIRNEQVTPTLEKERFSQEKTYFELYISFI